MRLRTKQTLDLKAFYQEFLKHMSNALPEHRRLTKMEREVLTEFWILEGDIIENDRFSTSIKRYIREEIFKFKNYTGLENYINKLLNKGFLVLKEGKKHISPKYDLSKDKIKTEGVVTLIYEYSIYDKLQESGT